MPDPATGKPRQRSRGGYRTKRECQAGLNDALAALRAGTFVETSRRTIGSFVRDEWLPVMELNLRPTTWTTYQGLLDAYVIPTLGAVELQRLTPGHLSVLYRELLTSGRRHRPGGLAPKTVRNVHVLIHRVLKDAVRWGYVVRNVADAADPPKVKPAELQVWSPGQLRAFLAHVRVIASTPPGCWPPPPACAAASCSGCVGSTSTWTPPASPSASRAWLPTTPFTSRSRRRPGAGGRSRSTR